VTRSVLALGLAAAGRRDEARVALGELDAMAAHTYVSPCRRAAVLVALGDLDRALERLEEACAERDPWVVFLRVDPAFARPRSEGRLDELLLRVLGPDSKRH